MNDTTKMTTAQEIVCQMDLVREILIYLDNRGIKVINYDWSTDKHRHQILCTSTKELKEWVEFTTAQGFQWEEFNYPDSETGMSNGLSLVLDGVEVRTWVWDTEWDEWRVKKDD